MIFFIGAFLQTWAGGLHLQQHIKNGELMGEKPNFFELKLPTNQEFNQPTNSKTRLK